MTIEPYLFFEGRCEEALAFYRKALGAEVVFMMRYNESPDPPPPGMLPPGSENKVMHATVKIGDATIMASDGEASGKPRFEGFQLAVNVRTEAEVDRMFDALAEGGKVTMAPTKTFWSPRFSMVEDRFGVGWMIGVLTPAP